MILYIKSKLNSSNRFVNGAGDGNRTHVVSLEGWSSAVELHLHYKWSGLQDSNLWPSGPKPDALPSWAKSRSLMYYTIICSNSQINGAPDRIRTHNPLIRSQVFYPIELLAHKQWRFQRDLNSRSPVWQTGMLTTTPWNHWCGRQESNLHSKELDPKSSASASSATPAFSTML